MAKKKQVKLKPTIADTIIVGISPALIIGMICCLVFFLVVAFYQGNYDQRLMYILGLYTMATVMIARIAIDSGRTYANLFSLPLAVVSVLAIMRFVTISGALAELSWIVNLALLALIWFLADRITFDCTLVDQRERGVQQGLLQSLGLLRQVEQSERGPSIKSKQRKHNPGVWVLYFALLAFPLFGLGQLVIPESAVREQAFYFLVGYLGCSLCLLVTTSFVNMRRYLRHRGVEMPAEISSSWLGYGAVAVLALLVIAMLLPLPGRTHGLVSLPFEFSAPDGLSTSQWGWGGEGENAGEGGKTSDSEQDSEDASGASSENVKSKNKAGSSEAGKKTTSGESGENSQNNSEQSNTPGKQSNDTETNNTPANDSEKGNSDSDQQSGKTEPKGDPESRGKTDSQGETESQGKTGDNSQEQSDTEPSEGSNQTSDQSESKSDESTAGESTAGESTATKPPATEPTSNWKMPEFLSGSFATILKWLTIAVLALIVLAYVVTHPKELANLWSDFLNFIANLFGRTRTSNTPLDIQPSTPSHAVQPRRRFAEFSNPFANPNRDLPPDEIVQYTFSALEAWAAERGMPRAEDQTASEYARQVARKSPDMQQDVSQAAHLLDQVLFGGAKPAKKDLHPLASLWQRLQRS